MRKVREVIRLKHEHGLSYRAISDATGIGKTAAAEYVHRAAVIGITWPVPEAVRVADLERRLFRSPGSEPARGAIDWPKVPEELKVRGVTLLLLWQEYRAEHPDGYGYSRYVRPNFRIKGASSHTCVDRCHLLQNAPQKRSHLSPISGRFG